MEHRRDPRRSMTFQQKLLYGLLLSLVLGASCVLPAADFANAGLLYDRFDLTLSSGFRTEAIGPLLNHEESESTRLWSAPPVFSYTLNEDTDFEEFDFAYPLLTYDRFGAEYRFQILQLFSFSGGQSQSETNAHRFTLFPFYFQQRSSIPEENYTALLPFYGHLQNRLFRDEVKFALVPLYLQSRKRDVVTDNYLYPFFHRRHGDGLKGWQFWPLIGSEHKEVTSRTNHWDELETIGGHDRFFALWPFFLNETKGIGTDNPERQQALLPFYSYLRSPQRDSSTYLWPFGFTRTVDREKKYVEWGAPWPFVSFARGEGKTTRRVWPFFSESHNETLESDFYLWPVYKFNRVTSSPLDRQRTRILFFLYSDLTEKNTETGDAFHRRDLWPLFTQRHDLNGNSRLQILSPLEPLLPNNKSLERNYSPLWSLWRSEQNAKTDASSQSLLWNLYRRESTPGSRKCSLLFGLFQYESMARSERWRLFYLPVGRATIQE